MVEWHRKDLTPEDVQKIIREGRNKDDNTTFDNYGDYMNYINKDNDRILNEHDHSQCEPNEETIEAMEEAVKDKPSFQDFLDELRNDREERDDRIYNLVMETLEENKPILDALGSDFDENGVPYWDKWENGGRKESDGNIN